PDLIQRSCTTTHRFAINNFSYLLFFFFIDPLPADIYTLSLHDALPILLVAVRVRDRWMRREHETVWLQDQVIRDQPRGRKVFLRSEEHTSELQSRGHLVCRLLLEKKMYDRLYSDSFDAE